MKNGYKIIAGGVVAKMVLEFRKRYHGELFALLNGNWRRLYLGIASALVSPISPVRRAMQLLACGHEEYQRTFMKLARRWAISPPRAGYRHEITWTFEPCDRPRAITLSPWDMNSARCS